jgi:hypothetical protein
MKDSVVNTLVTAATVLIVLPLLATFAAVAMHFGFEATDSAGTGMFGHMGAMQLVLLGWTATALVVVGGMIAALMKDRSAHA